MSESILMKGPIREAMILAAGFGKRLRPLTLTTPKPLIELNGIPLIQRALSTLREADIKSIVVNTHYLAPQIHNYLTHVTDLKINISHESELLETGGGIAKALPFFRDVPILSLNSDIWWEERKRDNIDEGIFQRLQAFWKDDLMDALLVVVSKDNALFYEGTGDFYWCEESGQLKFPSSNAVAPSSFPTYIYTGIQLIHPRLLKGRQGNFALPMCYREAAANNRLYGIELHGKWSDVGTLQSLQQLDDYLKRP